MHFVKTVTTYTAKPLMEEDENMTYGQRQNIARVKEQKENVERLK